MYRSLYFDCITVRSVLLHYAACIGLVSPGCNTLRKFVLSLQ